MANNYQYINKKGSASVTAVFVMLILTAIGVLAAINSGLNVRESRKALDWNVNYYALDSDGQLMLRYADEALTRAEKYAVEYMCSMGFLKDSVDGIPTDLQGAIVNLYKTRDDIKSFALAALNMAYFYYAKRELSAGQEGFYFALAEGKGSDWTPPEFHILPLADGNVVKELGIEAIFNCEKDKDYHLTVKLFVIPVKYELEISISNASVSGIKNGDGANYEIREWRQWDTPDV